MLREVRVNNAEKDEPLQKDEQQGVEIQFASSVANDSAMDVDEIKRDYEKIIAGIQRRMGFLDIEGSNRRREAQEIMLHLRSSVSNPKYCQNIHKHEEM